MSTRAHAGVAASKTPPRRAVCSSDLFMTIRNHTAPIRCPIHLLPASLLRYSTHLLRYGSARSRYDVLILSPAGQTGIGVILRRIAAAFRARGMRVALWQVSRQGGSPGPTIETAGKQLSRRGGRIYRDMGGRIHIRTDNTDNATAKMLQSRYD